MTDKITTTMNPYSATQNYLETSVATSDPVELTRMLFRAAIESLHQAQQAINQQNVALRTRQISRVQQIVAELATVLEPERAPELCLNLAQLYEYVLHLTQQGNFEQSSTPLLQAQQLLETLLEGWESCGETVTLASSTTVAA